MPGHPQDLVAIVPNAEVGHAGDDSDFEDAEQQMHAVGKRKNPAQTVERIDAGQIERHFFRQKQKAHLHQVRSDPGQHHQAQDGQKILGQHGNGRGPLAHGKIRVGRKAGAAAQLLGGIFGKELD